MVSCITVSLVAMLGQSQRETTRSRRRVVSFGRWLGSSKDQHCERTPRRQIRQARPNNERHTAVLTEV